MGAVPTASWQIKGEKVEVVTDFLFLTSKITADGKCIHEIRRQLLLGRKTMKNLDSVLKSRDITLPTKSVLSRLLSSQCSHTVVRAGPFVKKAECQRTDAFELWCWRTLLRVSWTAKRLN